MSDSPPSKKASLEILDDSDCIGPMPSTAESKPKAKKVLEHEKIYLQNLPSADMYEKSYMHRDAVTHIAVTSSNFVITASQDGHVKFWKKSKEMDIEFVKHFRSHMDSIRDLATSSDGTLACTVSKDKTLKVFDVINFDMINMLRLDFVPSCAGFVCRSGDALAALAVGDEDSSVIRIFDARGSPTAVREIKLHMSSVTLIRYNALHEVAVSVDSKGMVEYWSGQRTDFSFPKNIAWQHKTDTDLYDFLKCKCRPTGLTFSHDGELFATMATDRKIRLFKFRTAKITKVLDESLQRFTELQQMKQQLPNMEFGRRMAGEKDLEKSENFDRCNVLFDESGNFILYSTMLGIKVINLHTNRCVRMLGKSENVRFVQLALYQGIPQGEKASKVVTMEMHGSDNPTLQRPTSDPTLFCSAAKKSRFYLFTRRGPDDFRSGDSERDVFNEKPSKEELVSATQDVTYTKVASSACIHTSMGDIHVNFFPKECPKTVENFVTHSRNGYYNGLIFHRVIKGFMIQTGDPKGTGAGGESIWGGEFEDEIHPTLRHDKPYMLCMANAGPNTNGSQFFITLAPTPWLDNKHTVFGRVYKGMEVALNIGNAKTFPKNDKPYEDIRIVSITLK